VAVKIRIQHAAGRVAPLDRLLQGLPDDVEVIEDSGEKPNPWRGYKRCLSDLPDDGHVCVLQDDTIVCKNFAPALELIAGANPETAVCLFSGGMPRMTALKIKQATTSYVYLGTNEFLPMVAVLWPVHVARSFIEWTEENPRRLPGGPEARSDDAIGGRWVRFARQRVRVTVPSLVQHPDDVPSTIGKKAQAGVNKARVAALYIGNGDPLEIDWS
jgi:hypothetical protein